MFPISFSYKLVYIDKDQSLYVNIYKNAGNNERTYTSDNTVKPAGERIDPRSNEGQIIQQQYADQADRRVDNLAQSERFWAIREGQGSVKDLLYDSQSAEQRRLTDIFFEERNLICHCCRYHKSLECFLNDFFDTKMKKE